MADDDGELSKEQQSGLPFNVDERRYLRGMVEADKRRRWLFTSCRIWLTWIAGSIVSVGVVKAFIDSIRSGKW